MLDCTALMSVDNDRAGFLSHTHTHPKSRNPEASLQMARGSWGWAPGGVDDVRSAAGGLSSIEGAPSIKDAS